VTTVRGEFSEQSAVPKVRALPLAHLSIEVGHLYLEDVRAGPDRLRTLFAEAAPWVEAASHSARAHLPPGERGPRVSTCFLVDDYFSDLFGPAELVPSVLEMAEAAGVVIDYLARESACAELYGPVGRVSPAELAIGRLVVEPAPGTTGGRPPTSETGWLANGRRSPDPAEASAMDVHTGWEPPEQAARGRHSVFIDVELWDDDDGDRTWSCSALAATWQALRLGLLRADGEPLVEPVRAPDPWPADWRDLAPVVRLNPTAAPFAAYFTTSILSPRFLPIEAAVRTILGQIWPDPAVAGQLIDRAAKEGIALPWDVLDRISHVFAGSATIDPS
jgi:hypothetical protein